MDVMIARQQTYFTMQNLHIARHSLHEQKC